MQESEYSHQQHVVLDGDKADELLHGSTLGHFFGVFLVNAQLLEERHDLRMIKMGSNDIG